MIKNKLYPFLTVALATVSLFFEACQDEVSGIGNSISSSEVSITVDSLVYDLHARTVEAPTLDSRSAYTLVGSVDIPEYGRLRCSYVTQFLPAESLNLPDTITYERIDSVKMILSVPKLYITGDSLAPQQLKIYSLEKQLPSDISADFNPEGYYNPSSPLAQKNYTLSGYSYSDEAYTSKTVVEVKADLPLEFGRKVVRDYEENLEIFIWPETFAKYWPGVFVESSFGKGCIAPVSNTSVYAYYPQSRLSTTTDEEGKVDYVYTQVADSVCLFTTAPEVISSVNIDYSPAESLTGMIADGKSIITTPGGYTVSFTFPAMDILKEYWKDEYDLGVINNMIFSIPAKVVANSYGLGIAPSLVMVRSSELESFFEEGRVPDNKTSFASMYSGDTGSYTFNSMRQYIVDLKNKGEDNITPEDLEFTLVPVTLSTEDYTDNSTGNTVTAVTNVLPYIIMPTMAELDTQKAKIVFTYSNQTLY